MNNSGGILAAFSHQVSSSLAEFFKNLIKNVTKNLTLIFFIVFLRNYSFEINDFIGLQFEYWLHLVRRGVWCHHQSWGEAGAATDPVW